MTLIQSQRGHCRSHQFTMKTEMLEEINDIQHRPTNINTLININNNIMTQEKIRALS